MDKDELYTLAVEAGASFLPWAVFASLPDKWQQLVGAARNCARDEGKKVRL